MNIISKQLQIYGFLITRTGHQVPAYEKMPTY